MYESIRTKWQQEYHQNIVHNEHQEVIEKHPASTEISQLYAILIRL